MKETILIVDDTAANLGVLVDVIESAGWETRVAEDGASAMEQMEFGLPDLILLDVMMPEMDGFETCRRIKAQPKFQSIPIIFMTALSDVADKVRGLNAGAVDYITKPFHHEEVLARVRTHMEIVRLRRKLEEQNSLKDRFMQIATHDLRNPLASVIMASELLLHMCNEQYGQSGEMKEMLRHIILDAERMNEMIGSFLDFRKAASNNINVKIGLLNLSSLVPAIAENHASQANNKSISLVLDIPDGFTECSGDYNRTHQVVTNLISNAVKYTPSGGCVTLRLRADESFVRLDVADTGPGVPEKERERLFTEFAVTSNRPTAGETSTGLGLWIARKMSEAQGGSVGADFPESGGSVFWVTWLRKSDQNSGVRCGVT